MNQGEEFLREACAQIAQDETEELARSLSPAQLRQAEKLYRQHRRSILRQIERNSKKANSAIVPWLRAAACLTLAVGVAYLALHQSPPDNTPLSPGITASVAPYVSKDGFSTFEDELIETPTVSPTQISNTEEMQTIFPTTTPHQPFAAEAPLMPVDVWPGLFFPENMCVSSLDQLSIAEDQAAFSFMTEQGAGVFTEYFSSLLLSPVPGAAQDYVQIGDWIALRETSGDQIILTWAADGHTLRLSAPAAEAESIAETVKKLVKQ